MDCSNDTIFSKNQSVIHDEDCHLYGASSLCLKQGGILTASLNGSGVVGFWWKSSTPEYHSHADKVEFLVDGDVVGSIFGDTDWEWIEFCCEGDYLHNLEWRYVESGYGYEIIDTEQKVWIDRYNATTPQTLRIGLNNNVVKCSTSNATWIATNINAQTTCLRNLSGQGGRINIEVDSEGTLMFNSEVKSRTYFRDYGGDLYDSFVVYVDGRYVAPTIDEYGKYRVNITQAGPHLICLDYETIPEYVLSLTDDATVLLYGLVWDCPMPLIADDMVDDDVPALFDSVVDDRLSDEIRNVSDYKKFRDWASTVRNVNGSGFAGLQAVKSSPHAWLSFALGMESLLTKEPADGDIKIDNFEPALTFGKYDFEVSIEDVAVGSGATEENIKKVLGIEGTTKLGDDFDASNVSVSLAEPKDGKIKFTAGPTDTTATSFFMKVKMK